MSKKKPENCDRIFIAGAGGQGILQFGKILAQSAVDEDKNATYYPSYGAEVRGGFTNCTVVISEGEIVSPVVAMPETMIIMNDQSMIKFLQKTASARVLFVNSSFVKNTGTVKTPVVVSIPATQIAEELGNARCSNMVMLGSYVKTGKTLRAETVISVIEKVFRAKPDIVRMNVEAFRRGIKYD